MVDQLYPEVGIATVELLERFGVDVVFPDAHTCVGSQPSMPVTGATLGTWLAISPACCRGAQKAVENAVDHLGFGDERNDAHFLTASGTRQGVNF
jgi:hypothetical protein